MSVNRDRLPGEERPYLSVVIPAYNEEPRIEATLRTVVEYLGAQPYTWDVAVVNDGSTDATASLVNALAGSCPQVRLIALPHGGKGWAVAQGMLQVKGEYRFLCDADLSMPISQLARFLPPQATGFDIAIGSREVTGARRIGEPRRRHAMGRIYSLLVRLLAVPGVSDTQCGFKCFRGRDSSGDFLSAEAPGICLRRRDPVSGPEAEPQGHRGPHRLALPDREQGEAGGRLPSHERGYPENTLVPSQRQVRTSVRTDRG